MMHSIKYAVQCTAFFFGKKKYLQAKSSASYLWHYEEVGFWAKKKKFNPLDLLQKDF